MSPLRRTVVAACAVGVAATALAPSAMADDIPLPGTPDGITGIAWDEASGTVLVTDGDGTLARVDPDGGDGQPIAFTGRPASVQALALSDGMLHIADIGDEGVDREFVTIFRMDPASGSTSYWAWDFAYPDGARQAAAMAISGKGRFYIVTTGQDAGIYRAGLEPSRSGVNSLVRAADAPEGVTDAAFLADGSTLMLRTGEGVELLNAFTWEQVALTAYVDGPAGESISTFGPDRMLVGSGQVLRDEALPEGVTTVTPAPAATPTPIPGDATPSPTATPNPTPSAPEPSKVSRRGTLVALLGAGLVAVLAGVVVLVVRD